MSNRRHPRRVLPLLTREPSLTSGCARRRAKRIARRDHLFELDMRNAFRSDRLPYFAEAVSVCSCGRMAWMMPGGTAEDHEAFDRENADHDAMCEVWG